MLVLSRRIGETITIGNDVRITVLGGNGNAVRIGITAPKEIQVHREEVHRAIKARQDKGQ
jgi:carbon storage regulator